MPHDPKVLKTVIEAAAPPDMEIVFKSMFGGIMAYAEGKPFASLSDVGLGLKMAGDDHAALIALPGARAVQYDADQPPSKSYVCVPDTMLSDPDALRPWIVRSVSGLKTAPAKPRNRAQPL